MWGRDGKGGKRERDVIVITQSESTLCINNTCSIQIYCYVNRKQTICFYFMYMRIISVKHLKSQTFSRGLDVSPKHRKQKSVD